MIVFIDTMIYLHYKSIEEINFIDLLNADIVKIIIPRITIKELDKEKNTNGSDKIKERAKRTLDKIEKLLKNNSQIRDKVYLEYYKQLPNIDFEKIGLNPDWNDDYLVATIIQYKIENSNENEVCLITQDVGPRFSASCFGINVFEMPEKYKLPIEISKIEAENKDLKSKLEKLKNALPDLTIGFTNAENNSFAVFKLKKPPDLNEKYIEDEINKLKLKYPKMDYKKNDNDDASNSLSEMYRALTTSVSQIPKEEYDRYNKEVDIYLEKYKEYLNKNYENIAMAHRSIKFELEVRNKGTAPAEDIDLEIYFPDGFNLYTDTDDDFPEMQEKPDIPQKPMSAFQKLGNLNTNFILPRTILNNVPNIPNIKMPSTFKLKKTNSYKLTEHFNRIKHYDFEVLPEFFLVFNSFETTKSFKCEYTIRLANLPEPIIGEIHFKIEKSIS